MDTDYWRDGYIVRRKLVPEAMIDTLNQRFAAIADGTIAQAPNMQVARNVEVAKGFVTTPITPPNQAKGSPPVVGASSACRQNRTLPEATARLPRCHTWPGWLR